MKHIILIDENAISRIGLKLFLMYSLELTVDDVDSEQTIDSALGKKAADLLIINCEGISLNATALIRRLHREYPLMPVLVMGDREGINTAHRVLRAGAEVWLDRDCGTSELLDAVRALLAGKRFTSAAMAEVLINAHPDLVNGAQLHDALSDREYQVFCLLANGKSVSDIARELCLSVKTISTHKSRILEKTSLKGNSDIIRYALKNGMVQYD